LELARLVAHVSAYAERGVLPTSLGALRDRLDAVDQDL
jgi:hypothetical protein